MTRVAAIQMTSCANVARNLAVAGDLLRQAKAQGAVVAALPEMNFAGGNVNGTLCVLPGGRMVMGIGRGDSAVRYIGRQPMRPPLVPYPDLDLARSHDPTRSPWWPRQRALKPRATTTRPTGCSTTQRRWTRP